MKKIQCTDCDKQLMKDEVAISKKMLGRNIVAFFCLDCLATELDCEREDLEIKIQEFREQGCSLFL
jgi:biotin operon repressor